MFKTQARSDTRRVWRYKLNSGSFMAIAEFLCITAGGILLKDKLKSRNRGFGRYEYEVSNLSH
jgi:hypothetical protein